MLGAYTAAMGFGGMVTGMIVADTLQSIPTKNSAIPATGGSAVAKTTGNGTPVGKATTARQSLFLSAAVVVVAIVILFAGSRFLKDARIG